MASLGVNTFFKGSSAADIAVRDEIASDPSFLSASATGAGGDNGVLLGMLELKGRSLEALNGQSFGERYAEMVAGIGFEVNSYESSAISSQQHTLVVELQRDHVPDAVH